MLFRTVVQLPQEAQKSALGHDAEHRESSLPSAGLHARERDHPPGPQTIKYHLPGGTNASIQGLVKICDFGWSISTNTMRGTFCGTPLYVSPELLKRKNYNNKIDVWSVGILTYELLFGRVPFEIQTEQDFIKIVGVGVCRLRTR